ncbi:hypothetical protein HDU96_009114 [Phlyctochytrium bullatum]|nr:hypothetical protein HDU96_009114 [Phlyctochytrium bullatum]
MTEASAYYPPATTNNTSVTMPPQQPAAAPALPPKQAGGGGSSSAFFQKTAVHNDIINLGLRVGQFVLALICIICLATTKFGDGVFAAYYSGNNFFYFSAATTLLFSPAAILVPRFINTPPYFYLVVTLYDVIYAWFWLGAAAAVANLSTWCNTWKNTWYLRNEFNCGGIGAAAAFGFFTLFAFIGSIVFIDLLPVLTGTVTFSAFVNGRLNDPSYYDAGHSSNGPLYVVAVPPQQPPQPQFVSVPLDYQQQQQSQAAPYAQPDLVPPQRQFAPGQYPNVDGQQLPPQEQQHQQQYQVV